MSADGKNEKTTTKEDQTYQIIDNIKCCPGNIWPFGSSLRNDGGINFSINSANAQSCSLQLYHTGEREPFADIHIPDAYQMGDNFAIAVFDQDPKNIEYTFRLFSDDSSNLPTYFNPDTRMLDPYARLITGFEKWGQESEDRRQPHAKVVGDIDFNWEDDKPLNIPIEDLVIYEMHVRGFTQDSHCPAKNRGTYAGVVEMIPHLLDLGINCVELLPIFEYDELEPNHVTHGKIQFNYWGYSTLAFFAPKTAFTLSEKPEAAIVELKEMIKQLHRNGIEVILDVVFNHTANMLPDDDPGLYYRGIDTSIYYHLSEDGGFLNYSGCGNTLNCNHAIVRQHILDCLKYWVAEYHVDGFRFDEAPVLTRGLDGEPMKNPPVIEDMVYDPILSHVKLIAEPWDACGLMQMGHFPAKKRWFDWNAVFRDTVRHFIKSDSYVGPKLIDCIQGSPQLYEHKTESGSINFVTCHDGFTINDIVSYNEKHNLENGEDNRDGIHNNVSWNCGVEGPSDDPVIEALRSKQVKNAFTLLMLSRGVPMILAGDEFRNSQDGNNNAYCIDSPVSWVNWRNIERHKDVYEFCKSMIHLRHEHPVLRKLKFGLNTNSSGYPELSFYTEDASQLDIQAPFHTFGFLYAEPSADFGTDRDYFIYCGVNAYWEARRLILPELPEGKNWHVYAYSADKTYEYDGTVRSFVSLDPRSIIVLLGR